MSFEDQIPSELPLLPPYTLPTRRGYLKLTSQEDEFVGYLVQENRWSTEKTNAIIVEVPAYGTESSQETPQAIKAVGGKREGPWMLGVIGPRKRNHSRFLSGRRETKDTWSFNTHAMYMVDQTTYSLVNECWLMFGDELRLLWQFDDGSQVLVKPIKLKDKSTAGNLVFRTKVATNDVCLKLVFEEDSEAQPAPTAPAKAKTLKLQQQMGTEATTSFGFTGAWSGGPKRSDK